MNQSLWSRTMAKISLDPHICICGATWKTWHISKKCKHAWHRFLTFFAAATYELMGAIHVVQRCLRCALRLSVVIWNVYFKFSNKSICKYLFTYYFNIYVLINPPQNWPYFAYFKLRMTARMRFWCYNIKLWMTPCKELNWTTFFFTMVQQL